MSRVYTIENVRPRRTVSLYGRVLASGVSGGKASMDLTLEELVDVPCVRLLRSGRIRVVGEVPQALSAIMAKFEQSESLDSVPEESPEVSLPPETPVPSPVDLVEPHSLETEPSSEAAEDPETTPPPPQSKEEARAELEAKPTSELKQIAKDENLSTKGSKSELIARILGEEL